MTFFGNFSLRFGLHIVISIPSTPNPHSTAECTHRTRDCARHQSHQNHNLVPRKIKRTHLVWLCHVFHELMRPSRERQSPQCKYLQCVCATPVHLVNWRWQRIWNETENEMNAIKSVLEVNHKLRHKKIISELLNYMRKFCSTFEQHLGFFPFPAEYYQKTLPFHFTSTTDFNTQLFGFFPVFLECAMFSTNKLSL